MAVNMTLVLTGGLNRHRLSDMHTGSAFLPALTIFLVPMASGPEPGPREGIVLYKAHG
jgi:hypothetical protein